MEKWNEVFGTTFNNWEVGKNFPRFLNCKTNEVNILMISASIENAYEQKIKNSIDLYSKDEVMEMVIFSTGGREWVSTMAEEKSGKEIRWERCEWE